MKPDHDSGGVVQGAETKSAFGPESEKLQPAARVNSGSEPKVLERATLKRPRKTRIEGSKRLSCKRCDHFLGEIKVESGSWEYLTPCHRCKTENHFVFETLKS